MPYHRAVRARTRCVHVQSTRGKRLLDPQGGPYKTCLLSAPNAAQAPTFTMVGVDMNCGGIPDVLQQLHISVAQLHVQFGRPNRDGTPDVLQLPQVGVRVFRALRCARAVALALRLCAKSSLGHASAQARVSVLRLSSLPCVWQ